MITIQQRLKNLRQSKRITCRQLSVKTGIEQSKINRIENGYSSLSWDDLLRFAHGFDMTPIELILPVDFSVEVNAA